MSEIDLLLDHITPVGSRLRPLFIPLCALPCDRGSRSDERLAMYPSHSVNLNHCVSDIKPRSRFSNATLGTIELTNQWKSRSTPGSLTGGAPGTLYNAAEIDRLEQRHPIVRGRAQRNEKRLEARSHRCDMIKQQVDFAPYPAFSTAR